MSEFAASRPVLQKMLKEIPQRKEKLYRSKAWIYIEKGKKVWEGINKGKIKTFIFPILIEPTDSNNVFIYICVCVCTYV